MTLATKNGSLLIKDGKLAEDCGCCGGGRCGCTTGIINANLITLDVSGAELLSSPTANQSEWVGYQEMRDGGACDNDSSVIEWLNGVTVPLVYSEAGGSWMGQAVTQSHVSAVTVSCVLVISCDGSASLKVIYCPDGSSSQTCMRRYGAEEEDTLYFSVGANPCTSSSGSVGGDFIQANASLSGAGCRLGIGGLIAFRRFGLTYTLSANSLP